jgi:hypothetical protein
MINCNLHVSVISTLSFLYSFRLFLVLEYKFLFRNNQRFVSDTISGDPRSSDLLTGPGSTSSPPSSADAAAAMAFWSTPSSISDSESERISGNGVEMK